MAAPVRVEILTGTSNKDRPRLRKWKALVWSLDRNRRYLSD